MDIRIFEIKYKRANHIGLKLARFSDLHLVPEENNKRALSDLTEAANENRRISLNGDSLNCIYPTDLKRYTRSKDRGDYDAKLNKDTEFLYEFLRPFVDNIDIISVGNHEGSVLKHNHYDVIRGVISHLNHDRSKALGPIYQGDYRGFERYRLTTDTGGNRVFDLFRHHFKGGGAPVTKGMIDISRISDGWSANFYHGGHKHTAIMDAGRIRYGVSPKGKLQKRTIQAFITPGYQSSVSDTTEKIDKNGGSIPYEETFYTGTPQGYGVIDVYPMDSDHEEPIKVRATLRT